MKYICLGYIEPGKFQGMTEEAQHAILDACFEYDDHLRAKGHFAAGEALQPPENALTLYWKKGKVATTERFLCENQRTARRHPSARGARPESCHSAHFAASGFEVWAVGNTTSCGFERNDEGKRTAAEKYRTINAAPVWSKMSAQASGRKEHRCQKFV